MAEPPVLALQPTGLRAPKAPSARVSELGAPRAMAMPLRAEAARPLAAVALATALATAVAPVPWESLARRRLEREPQGASAAGQMREEHRGDVARAVTRAPGPLVEPAARRAQAWVIHQLLERQVPKAPSVAVGMPVAVVPKALREEGPPEAEVERRDAALPQARGALRVPAEMSERVVLQRAPVQRASE